MRTLAVVFALAAASTACKSKSDAGPAPDPAAVKAQQDLMKRRDDLLQQREQLQGERQKVEQQIQQVQASGGDTTALAKQRDDLTKQIEGQSAEVIASLSNLKDSIAAAGDAQAGIAAREASMGTREKTVATRESALASREAQLASREAALAQREKETCGAGAPPVVIQQVAPPRAGTYSRKDVEPYLAKARATMAKKGILPADLGAASGLEGEATKAMAENDWGKAWLAATQLSSTVDTVKIDRAFIMSKYGRLNARVNGGGKVDDAQSAQLTDGMKDVMQKYGDGDFAGANKRLNQLASIVH